MVTARTTSLVILLFAAVVSGCAAPVGSALQTTDIISLNESAQQQQMVLGNGDELAVKSYHNPALNDVVTIRPDGNITLQLIGEIRAAGKTPLDLTAMINSEYAKTFKTITKGYSLAVGDKVSIKFYYNSELNEDLVIRPDGKVSLQLIGDVDVAGLTPAQLQDNLKKLYMSHLGSTEIAVIVRDFRVPEVILTVRAYASRKVYVGGEVAKPGTIPLNGAVRSADAIFEAGGALPGADLKNAVIIRYNGTPKPTAFSLNLNLVLRGELPDLELRPYDVIYVPKTPIAKLDLFVEQYLNKIIPRSVSFPFMYNINPEVRIQ